MINKVILVGRLGKDPEVRYFENDNGVANFSLATSERYKDRDGNRVEQTEWHNIAVWRPALVKVAENYLRKGSLIYAEGKLKTRSWDDKDGNKRYTTEVVVDNFQMLDRKDGSNSGDMPISAPAAQQSSGNASPANNEIDDLPF